MSGATSRGTNPENPTSNVGHGALGLRDGLRPFTEWMGETASEKRTYVEVRPSLEITGWAAYSGACYVAPCEFDFDGIQRDVVAVATLEEAALTRVQTLDECVSTAGTFYYDPDATTGTAYWDDGVSAWDGTSITWDDFPKLYVHLTDESSPEDTTVVASFGFHFASHAEVHPDLGEELLTDGGLEDWPTSSTLTSWDEAGDGGMAIAQEDGTNLPEGLLVPAGTYALRFVMDGTAVNTGQEAYLSQTLSSTTFLSGACYRLSGYYRTDPDWLGEMLLQVLVGNATLTSVMSDDGRNFTGAANGPTLTPTGGEWRRFVFDFQATRTTRRVEVRAYWTGPGGTLPTFDAHLDGLSLKRIWRWNWYDERVSSSSVPATETGSNDVFFGGKRIGQGTVSLLNTDGLLERLDGRVDLVNHEVRVWVGGAFADGQEILADDWRRAFTGKVQRVAVTDKDMRLDLQDSRTFFHVKLPLETYTDETWPSMDLRFQGKPRPLWFGAKENITPVRLDEDAAFLGNYELADATDSPAGIKSIDTVYGYQNETAAKEQDTTKRVQLKQSSDYADETLTDIFSPTAWWKADNISSPPADGGNLATWTDSSGNGRSLAQATEADKPSYHLNVVNGYPAIKFDKANGEYLESSAAMDTLLSAADGYIFAVVKPITLNTDDAATWANNEFITSSTGSGTGLFMRSSGKVSAHNYDGSHDDAFFTDTAQVAAGKWMLAMWRHTGGNIWAAVNDLRNGFRVGTASGNSTILSTRVLRMGCNPGATVFADMYVAEAATFNSTLTDSQMVRIERYFQKKYGASLATSTQDTTTGLKRTDPVHVYPDLTNARFFLRQAPGPLEVTADNCKIDFNVGGSALVATLTTGLYTPQDLALEVADKMTTAAGGTTQISCTISPTTHLATIAFPGGATGTLQILAKTGANKEITALKLLGFTLDADLTGATTYTGTVAIYSDPDKQAILRVDGQGFKDDASGTYTGTASALVEIGADILRVLFVKYLKQDAALIDKTSFAFARSRAPESLALYLKDTISTKDVFDRLEFSNISNIVVDGEGRIYCNVYVGEVPDSIVDLFDEDFLSFEVERSVSDVYGTIRVQHDQDPSTGEWESRSATSDSTAARFGRTNLREFETYIKTGDNAQAAANRMRELAKAPARKLRFTVKAKLVDKKVGDKVRLTRRRASDPNGKLSSQVVRLISLRTDFQRGQISCEAVDDVVTVAGIACANTCQSLCESTCQSGCQAVCQATCEGACQAGCQTACQVSCEGTCQTSCETGACQSACETGCQGACQASCQGACQGGACESLCESSCQTACETGCQTTCQVTCQNACQQSCQTACEAGCQSGCETTCQTACESTCQTSCEVNCETACQQNCQTFCQVVCQVVTEGGPV